MNELRFSCSKCGQHLKAEAGCADRVIQCPVCQANVRIPGSHEAADDGSLPTAWETTSIVTAASAVARTTTVRSSSTGAGETADPSAEVESAALESFGRGARNQLVRLLAAMVVVGVVGVSLWLWKPWQTEVTLAPPSPPEAGGSRSAPDANTSGQAARRALQAVAAQFVEAVAQGKPEAAEALVTDQARPGAVLNFVEFLRTSAGGDGALNFTPGQARITSGEEGTVAFDVHAGGERGTLRIDARSEAAGWRVFRVHLEGSTAPNGSGEPITVSIDFTRHTHPMEAMMAALGEAMEPGVSPGTPEMTRGGGPDGAGQPAPDTGIDAGEAGAFAASWMVDFATLPDDARALVDAQLEPLGLAVSPSIYTVTRGREVRLPARRGTRLELIEELGRQLGWKPVYDGRQLKFERGVRTEPVAFAGPFMLQVVQVTPSTAYATAELTLRLTGVGIPDALRQSWMSGFVGLQGITARAPDGTDLTDPHDPPSSGMPNAGARLMEADCVVNLWHAFRGVTRLASLRAELELPGMPPPHDRLRFEFTDLPLKPGPATPAVEHALVFSGDAPVAVQLHSIIPEEPFDRARVEIQNLADRPLRHIRLDLVYRAAGGEEIRRMRSEHSGDRELPGVREKRRLDRVMLVGKPEDTVRVEVEVAGAVFAGGLEWKRAE